MWDPENLQSSVQTDHLENHDDEEFTLTHSFEVMEQMEKEKDKGQGLVDKTPKRASADELWRRVLGH